VETAALSLAAAPCDAAGARPELKAALAQDGSLHDRLVDAMSMRNRDKSPQNGHDLFFGTFAKFDAAAKSRGGDIIAEATARAGAANLQYVELMLNPDAGTARQAGRRVGWNDDFHVMRDALLAPVSGRRAGDYSIPEIVAGSRAWLDTAEARRRTLLACDGGRPDPGCAVTVRYIYQVLRAMPPEVVFAQMVYAFEMASADARMVAVNLVQPEDDPAAVANFRQQMRMLDYLHAIYPKVAITLHAGELAPGLVPPDVLRFHVRESIETGHARRIGHGVDVMHEDDPYGLLRELARRNVLVEICLTSNDLILGVRGREHPLRTLMQFGVPVALATDDEGVSRSDINGEYRRAVEDQGLRYRELKTMARASLEHAFVEGASLWTGPRTTARVAACARDLPGTAMRSPACARYLDANTKARLQMTLEDGFAAFEQAVATEAAAGLR
jgi:adenosine deaminase/adenosine deaminase CECR1